MTTSRDVPPVDQKPPFCAGHYCFSTRVQTVFGREVGTTALLETSRSLGWTGMTSILPTCERREPSECSLAPDMEEGH
jgi:hypothetical protein